MRYRFKRKFSFGNVLKDKNFIRGFRAPLQLKSAVYSAEFYLIILNRIMRNKFVFVKFKLKPEMTDRSLFADLT